MLDQLMKITPTEIALAIFAVAMLVQLAVFRAHVNSAAAKGKTVRFPGLMTSLARIPVRTEDKPKS